MRIAAIIITFHPDKKLLQNNIEAIHNYVDKILIWQNSDDDLSDITAKYSGIEVIGDKTNHFIAKPLNQALQWCRENGYDYLLTMDQDSVWEDFAGFISETNRFNNNPEIGIFAPNTNNFIPDKSIPFIDKEWVIQSGMLLNLHALNGLGGFREEYQIYGVDEEFCYWVNLHHKKVRVMTRFNLQQKYGNAQKTIWGFTVYNYSPIVRYFLIRNMIWMKREFPKSTTTRRICSVIVHNYRDIILAEKNKFAKLTKFTLGIIHGLFREITTRQPINP